MSNLKKISIEDFTISFEILTEFHKNSNDPLPELNNRADIIPVLDYPFQSVFGKVLYWGFYKKASCYFYGFSKGHIFANGNKRAGVMAVNIFYKINDRKLNIPQDEMYDMAKYIANSKSDDKEEVINTIAKFLKRYK